MEGEMMHECFFFFFLIGLELWHTVRPPRRFYKFRTRMMREIAGKGLKITENPCETHARATRNQAKFLAVPAAHENRQNSRRDFYNFHA